MLGSKTSRLELHPLGPGERNHHYSSTSRSPTGKSKNRQKASQRNSTRRVTVEHLDHHNVNMYAFRNGFLQDTGLKYSWCRVVNYRCGEESTQDALRLPKSFFVRLAEIRGGKRCRCLRSRSSAWRSMARCSTVQQGATRRRREVPMHCRDPGGWALRLP